MFKFARSKRFMVPVLGLTVLHSCALLCAQTSPPDRSAPQDAKFKIAGTIVSSLTRTPLAQARVSLFDTANPANALWMITSDTGHFKFASLKQAKCSSQEATLVCIRPRHER